MAKDSWGSQGLWEELFALAESLTGQAYTPQQKTGVLRANFTKRMRDLQLEGLQDYFQYLEDHDDEIDHFLSMATIHTTHWFREKPHFEFLAKFLEKKYGDSSEIFNLLVAACSTGQEAYTYALVLEAYRKKNPKFQYSIVAFDVDPLSVEISQKGIYPCPREWTPSWSPYREHIKLGTQRAEGLFTFTKEIRSRMSFSVDTLTDLSKIPSQSYDWISCRNVLIYFSPKQIEKIVTEFKSKLKDPAGILCLGHSDSFDYEKLKLRPMGNSLFVKIEQSVSKGHLRAPAISQGQVSQFKKPGSLRALVIDDSAVVRTKLKKILETANWEVECAKDAEEADQILRSSDFDFITLDLQMPGENGIQWIQRKRKQGFKPPVVMVSDSTPADAPQILDVLGREIQDFFDKSTLSLAPHLLVEKAMVLGSLEEVISAKKAEKSPIPKKRPKEFTGRPKKKIDLILIGASTGGTTALGELLTNFPQPAPPIIIVQHITHNFAKPFAERLAKIMGLKLGEPVTGVPLEPNTLYMSWRDEHIGVKLVGEIGRAHV